MINNRQTFSADFYKALSFAAKAHDGQYDKAGEPYILHPIAVSSLLTNKDEIILALLHDIVEDTAYTLDDIAALGFGHLTNALDCLSRREGEMYDEFISRILQNRMAAKVKVADIKHNLSRIGNLPENERGFADRYKKWLPVLEAELKRERIVAAHAGTGKTYMAKLFPEKFIDFVSMPYKYHLPDEYAPEDDESCKANPDYELNMDWPENYFDAIMAKINNSDKILLVPPDWRLLWTLTKEGVPYILCYPEKTEEAKESYRKRYVQRGNTKHFLEIFIDGWDKIIDSLATDSFARHIVLKPHQFLTDVAAEI